MRILAGALLGAALLGGCMSTAPQGAVLAAHKGAAVEDKYATSPDGVRIHYVASGKGPLVLAIHGYPDFSATWDQLRPWLDDSYRFVAIDTRGYNLSDKPEGVANYEMPKLIADVDAVIKAEGYEKATVIGHDWGGSIAWMFAFYYPQRLENLVVLSTPHPSLFMREMRTNPVQQANSQYARNNQKEGSEAGLTAEGLARRVTDPVMHEKYVEAFKRSSFAGMMNYYRANYPKTAGPEAVRPFMPDPVPKIEVPLLVIHGMKDTALMAQGHSGTWDVGSKDSTLMMIPEAGHFVQQDAADKVNPMIRNWLDMHRAKK